MTAEPAFKDAFHEHLKLWRSLTSSKTLSDQATCSLVLEIQNGQDRDLADQTLRMHWGGTHKP